MEFSFSDNFSNYISLLLKVEQPTMEVSHMWNLTNQVLKTLKSLNPDFKHTYFNKCLHSARKK